VGVLYSVAADVHFCLPPLPTTATMIEATFTEFRKQAKHFFDLVLAGKTVRISRNGRPIADIGPIPGAVPVAKKRKAAPARAAAAKSRGR
jgi:antitoxin (DNA-binding transcriptional repressor) of toxin-antitoxin stability system